METRPITLSEIKSLPQAIAVIEELLASLVQFEERIAALEAENKRLKDQLKLDSHNSSLPPSADKGRQRKSTTSLRNKSVTVAWGLRLYLCCHAVLGLKICHLKTASIHTRNGFCLKRRLFCASKTAVMANC